MVDRINNNGINPLLNRELLDIGTEKAEGVSTETSSTQSASAGGARGINDEALISSDAKLKLAQEKEALRFSRIAMQTPAEFDGDKVAHLRDLLDNGRINEYLRNINTDELVDAILAGPSSAFLR